MNSKQLIVALWLSVAASGSAWGNTDMDNVLRALDQDKPELYEVVMTSFIASAKAGDIDKMVALTSAVTVKKIGLENLKGHYRKDTVPALRACTRIARGADVIHLDKQSGDPSSGWAYRKTCITGEGKSILLQFVILNENGRIALASFERAR